jgi:adenylate cyclase
MTAPVFVSYASKDRGAALSLCHALENRGSRCWISTRDIGPGENFQVAIPRAIHDAKVMVLVFSAESNNSNEVKKELALAGQNRLIVIPVRVEDVTPGDAFAYELATHQWIDLFEDWENSIQRLSEHLLRVAEVMPQPAAASTSLGADCRIAGDGAERQRRKTVGEGKQALALPDKPSLAVLPFQNMTGDADQEYFVDGMVEEITTAIARLPWLFVIARNSAFTYKGKPVDVKQVAQELGVRYVLEGSVRKAGNRVRITGQLIDTATGAHIWADRFDGALDDIFALQDQVASNVAGAIEPKLRQSEIERASHKATANLTAYDLYLRASAEAYRFTDEGFVEAIALARRALAIDPAYTPAAALVGLCRVRQRVQGWGALSDEDIGEACRLARQVLEAERDDAEPIWQAALTLFRLAGEAAMAAAALDRALALNPNAARAWLARGIIHAWRNQPEAAIEAIERARRLSPFDQFTPRYALNIAFAHLVARCFEQAIEWADRALHDQPRLIAAMRVKVAALAHLGHLEEARAELSRSLGIDPKQTIAGLREYARFAAPEVLELYVTGLRVAGLPEK